MADFSNLPPLPPDYSDLPALPPGYQDAQPSTPTLAQLLQQRRIQASDTDTGPLTASFFAGAAKPVLTLSQLAAKGVAPSASAPIENVYQAVQNWGQRKGAPGQAGAVADFLGSMAPLAAASYAIPGAGAAALLPRMVSGAIGGALSGASQRVDPNAPDYWEQVKANTELGGTEGAAAQPILRGIAGLVGPNV